MMYYVLIAIEGLRSKKEGGLEGENNNIKIVVKTGVIESMLPIVLEGLFCESRCLLFGRKVESKAAEGADQTTVLPSRPVGIFYGLMFAHTPKIA